MKQRDNESKSMYLASYQEEGGCFSHYSVGSVPSTHYLYKQKPEGPVITAKAICTAYYVQLNSNSLIHNHWDVK